VTWDYWLENFCARRLGSTGFSLWVFFSTTQRKIHRLKSVLLVRGFYEILSSCTAVP
jgi:hypothetical protein